ncbi:MAG: hypothetical protein LIO43_05875 [Clostridiales bacterium]|nr:hypothetical protein [Clostridiales bacterium]
MKKLILLIPAFIIAISVFLFPFGALADDERVSVEWEGKYGHQDILACVNGELRSDVDWNVQVDYDDKNNYYSFTYSGDGVLTGWEFPLLEEGKDYEIVSEGKNKIIIHPLEFKDTIPYVNALVDFGENESSYSQENKSSADISETETLSSQGASAEKSDGNNSGSSLNRWIMAAGVCAVVIAAAAVIVVYKNKHK